MTDFIYHPDKFAKNFNSPEGIGRKLWDFLNEQDSITRLVTATELGRPAVEGVANKLFDRFGYIVTFDRNKQMTGHMVRQIMERLGYKLDAQNVLARAGGVFTRASRYIDNRELNKKFHHIFKYINEVLFVEYNFKDLEPLPFVDIDLPKPEFDQTGYRLYFTNLDPFNKLMDAKLHLYTLPYKHPIPIQQSDDGVWRPINIDNDEILGILQHVPSVINMLKQKLLTVSNHNYHEELVPNIDQFLKSYKNILDSLS